MGIQGHRLPHWSNQSDCTTEDKSNPLAHGNATFDWKATITRENHRNWPIFFRKVHRATHLFLLWESIYACPIWREDVLPNPVYGTSVGKMEAFFLVACNAGLHHVRSLVRHRLAYRAFALFSGVSVELSYDRREPKHRQDIGMKGSYQQINTRLNALLLDTNCVFLSQFQRC